MTDKQELQARMVYTDLTLSHDIATALIAQHGGDRYPDVYSQVIKLAIEVKELTEALLAKHVCNQPPVLQGTEDRVRSEFAQVGICLHELGNKLGLNLPIEMFNELHRDTRTLTAGDLKTEL